MYVPLKDKKQIFSSRKSRRDFKYDYGVQRVENQCTIRYQWYSFSNYLFLENREGRKKLKKNMTEKKFAEGIINQAPNIVFES